MHGSPQQRRHTLRLFGVGLLLGGVIMAVGASPAGSAPAKNEPKFSEPAAFDVSKPLRELAKTDKPPKDKPKEEVRPEKGRNAPGKSDQSDGAVQSSAAQAAAADRWHDRELRRAEQPGQLQRLRPPREPARPGRDVGPNHYVEMVNLVFAVYSKTGTRLLGPVDTGALWADFPVEECTDPSGDPIVIYDQSPTAGCCRSSRPAGIDADEPTEPFYNCVAVSTTGDPTGAYYRYALHAPASTSSRTTRSTASGGTRTSSRPASSGSGREQLRDQRLRPGEEQDGRRRSECPRRQLLPPGHERGRQRQRRAA